MTEVTDWPPVTAVTNSLARVVTEAGIRITLSSRGRARSPAEKANSRRALSRSEATSQVYPVADRYPAGRGYQQPWADLIIAAANSALDPSLDGVDGPLVTLPDGAGKLLAELLGNGGPRSWSWSWHRELLRLG